MSAHAAGDIPTTQAPAQAPAYAPFITTPPTLTTMESQQSRKRAFSDFADADLETRKKIKTAETFTYLHLDHNDVASADISPSAPTDVDCEGDNNTDFDLFGDLEGIHDDVSLFKDGDGRITIAHLDDFEGFHDDASLIQDEDARMFFQICQGYHAAQASSDYSSSQNEENEDTTYTTPSTSPSYTTSPDSTNDAQPLQLSLKDAETFMLPDPTEYGFSPEDLEYLKNLNELISLDSLYPFRNFYIGWENDWANQEPTCHSEKNDSKKEKEIVKNDVPQERECEKKEEVATKKRSRYQDIIDRENREREMRHQGKTQAQINREREAEVAALQKQRELDHQKFLEDQKTQELQRKEAEAKKQREEVELQLKRDQEAAAAIRKMQQESAPIQVPQISYLPPPTHPQQPSLKRSHPSSEHHQGPVSKVSKTHLAASPQTQQFPPPRAPVSAAIPPLQAPASVADSPRRTRRKLKPLAEITDQEIAAMTDAERREHKRRVREREYKERKKAEKKAAEATGAASQQVQLPPQSPYLQRPGVQPAPAGGLGQPGPYAQPPRDLFQRLRAEAATRGISLEQYLQQLQQNRR